MIVNSAQYPKFVRFLVCVAFAAVGFSQAVAVVDVYETNFESFTSGADQLVGSEGWTGTNAGEAVHGIDEGLVQGLGKTAFLGFNSPSTDFVSVARSVSYDPLGSGNSTIEFFSLLGIEDSTNGEFDRFYISFYNGNDELLGAIAFDNTPADFGVLRYDGNQLVHTGEIFVNNTVQGLFVSIDYLTNTWSAKLDGLPVFTNETFNATGVTLDLGSIAAEWEVTSSSNPGNNWMLFDEWTVTAHGDDEVPVISGVPLDLAVSTDPGQATAVVHWSEPTSSDNVAVSSVVSSHENGGAFPIGETEVTYTASDGAGNVASATFTISVSDGERPSIAGFPKDVSLTVSSSGLPAVVAWEEPVATDNVGVVEFSSNLKPGDAFSEGETIVTYLARDAAGNMQSMSFSVNVEVSIAQSGSYLQWLEFHFKDPQVDGLADADNDRLNNMFEFGIGSNPLVSEGNEGTGALPRLKMSSNLAAASFSYEFVTAQTLSQSVKLEVLQSLTLEAATWEVIASREGNKPWAGPSVASGELQLEAVEGSKERVTIVCDDTGGVLRRFYQLRVVVTPD